MPNSLIDGGHTIVVSETDAAGNVGTASLIFAVDTHAPVPTITNEIRSQNKVTLSGTVSEAYDSISVYDGSALLWDDEVGQQWSVELHSKGLE